MKKNIKILVYLFICISSSFLFNTSLYAEKITIHLKRYKDPCMGAFFMSFCYKAKDHNANSEWYSIYENINNFEYQWGYDYKLYIEKNRIKNPLADGPLFTYNLINIISKSKNDEPFKIWIFPPEFEYIYLIKKSRLIYTIYSEKDIKCKVENCKNLDSLLLNEKKSILIIFKAGKKNMDPLNVIEIIKNKRN